MQGTVPYSLVSHGHLRSNMNTVISAKESQNVSNINGGNENNKEKSKDKEVGAYSGGLSMRLTESGISNNSEWILFSPFDEDVSGNGGSHHSADSILSTRLSTAMHSPIKYRRSDSFETSGYVISDFDESMKSGHISEEGEQEDEEDEEEEEEDYETDDDDSLTDDVRSDIQHIQRSRLDELQNKKQNELVNKIDKWKNNVRSMSTSIEKPQFDKTETKDIIKVDKSRLNRKDQDLRKREIKAFKKVVGQLCTSLKKEGLVEHEGVFMNNPDLESCVPGYWKRLMLDNLIQYTSEQPIAIDIKNKNAHNRNFWEPEESGSVQSTSTGWEGGSILGF